MTRGTRANRRGRALETSVADLLSEDYERITPARFFAARCLQQPIYAAQVPTGLNIYAKQRRVDFILHHPQKWPDCLVIQCKWQASSGSVDEKFPFEVECIAHDAFPAIIVLDGGGASKGAKDWLLSQRGKRNLVDVLDQGGLHRWQTQGRI